MLVMDNSKIRIGISQGDINGISYEVIIKALMESRILDLCIPVVYGSPKVGAYHRKALNINNFSFTAVKTALEANPKRVNIIDCLDDNVRVELGKSTSMAGDASFRSLTCAVNDLREGFIDALVTGPINKHNIQSDNFKFRGHTEYLASQFGVDDVLMVMVSQIMKVAVATSHIALSEVPGQLSVEMLLSKLRLLNNSLVRDFGIRKPRIAVLGLNPHAGEEDLIGSEENQIIKPALEIARNEKIMALGPFPADGFFASENFTRFDAILAMYHDQGLIPFKALAFETGVNYTAGLPVIRTSPGHGTAFEIAGKNVASPDPFRQAVYLAIDIHRNRKSYDELVAGSVVQGESQNNS
jgi:4-hydroxythreonine-4-phosphate dehydrogenase